MSEFNSLPDDVLKLVMRKVPAKDRLTCCCLVNSRLHAAAVAASDALTLGLRDWFDPDIAVSTPQRAQAGLEWLASRGQHVTSLVFHSFPQTLQQLPCPNLLELKVQYTCSVQLGPSVTSHPGVIPGCTNLTKLELLCNIINTSSNAELCGSLSSLVHLQHLNVQPKNERFGHRTIEGLSSGTLPCLKHLTYLNVHNLSIENIPELGRLTNLQEMCLKAGRSVVVGPNSVPGLVFPASLTQLQLCSPVEAEVLLSVPAGLQDLGLHCAVQGPAEGPSSLLFCISRLPPLTVLHCFVLPTGLSLPPPGPAYSALTASSNLVDFGVSADALPAAVWPFVLPAERMLPHLTQFCANFVYGLNEPELHATWGAADVARLVSCCPNLCRVDLAMQHGAHVSQLHKLPALTALEMTYGPMDRSALPATIEGLAAVTQLQRLILAFHRCSMGTAPLLPLTRLTALTFFAFTCNIYLDEEDAEGDDYEELEVYLYQVSHLACAVVTSHALVRCLMMSAESITTQPVHSHLVVQAPRGSVSQHVCILGGSSSRLGRQQGTSSMCSQLA
jgi:hypothetical protein